MAMLLSCGTFVGCSALGIALRAQMLEVQNETVAAPVGADLSMAIVRAATARRWTAVVTAPDVVRCRFDARSWNIVVDVRHSGPVFSIEYVSTEGLFYRPERHDIHRTYNRQIEALRQRIRHEAMKMPAVAPVTPVASVAPAASAAPAATAAVPVAPPAPPAKPYVIELFSREAGNKYAYRFVLKLNDMSSADLALSRRIQADLRQSVRDDYAASSGMKDAAALRIEFPEYAIRDGKVEGRAVVMTIQLLEFVYDPDTARGRLAVKVDPQQYEVTRQWVRNNIATLARDKNANILNVLSGKPRFTIGREVLRDDSVLEVEFQAGAGE